MNDSFVMTFNDYQFSNYSVVLKLRLLANRQLVHWVGLGLCSTDYCHTSRHAVGNLAQNGGST